MNDPQNAAAVFNELIDIMMKLRDPEYGCPWDVEQTFVTIAPYTIEEAYEVADAIERGDMQDLKEELGDLLLQVFFHSQIARESGHFTIADVARAIGKKMQRRHPHVFGNARISSAADQSEAWESYKARERTGGALDGVALALPALMRAQKLQKRAARVGFDWPDASGPRLKIDEELAEVADAGSPLAVEEEIGDLLFAVVNYARHLEIDAEQALRRASMKFERRFNAMEALAQGSLQALNLAQLEALWRQIKIDESASLSE